MSPRYAYACECGSAEEAQRSVADRHQGPICTACGLVMDLMPAAPGFSVKGGTPKGRGGRSK
jgi:predicted nucleic acid-binding Zn ribbon protein